MISNKSCNLIPSLFVTHGGGPLPLLDKQNDIAELLRSVPSRCLYDKPNFVLVITAHWITNGITVSSSQKHKLLFDYSGFQKESYELEYNAPGSPILAEKISSLLNSGGIYCSLDDKRGLDHGVFVPLMLMYPSAEIPIVSMSIDQSLDPEMHIRIGNLLSSLREENVLIIGSGSSFHNFDYFFTKNRNKLAEGIRYSKLWQDFLAETLTSPEISEVERNHRLITWKNAPGGIQAHPIGQEEHLIPLHVIFFYSITIYHIQKGDIWNC